MKLIADHEIENAHKTIWSTELLISICIKKRQSLTSFNKSWPSDTLGTEHGHCQVGEPRSRK